MAPWITKSGTLLAIHRELYRTRKTLRTDRKKNPVYSFWSRTLSWVFVWSQIYRNRWSQTIKINFQKINNFFPFLFISFPNTNPEIFSTSPKVRLWTFEYSPGKDMLVSDTLSRSHLSDSEPEFTENSLIHHVHFVQSNIPISETRLKQFQLETKNNPNLKALITYTTHEWPEKHLIATDWYPPQWYYILWRYPFEEWTNRSTHYPSSRNKIPYPPTTFRNWKLQKTRLAIIILATNGQWNWRHD